MKEQLEVLEEEIARKAAENGETICIATFVNVNSQFT